jgi:hypothetical protein
MWFGQVALMHQLHFAVNIDHQGVVLGVKLSQIAGAVQVDLGVLGNRVADRV